ncbi:spatacsin-like isoform X1 [Haliotis rufescens]|uniref:spatacsin-like isoform X1 n=1 Tax=Haliotis rufescens TaxID=6454 RepID=UPI00201FB094|nr:spatacsin-like isoform X1 [Haliotis rufescens]
MATVTQGSVSNNTCLQCRLCKLCNPINLKENAKLCICPKNSWLTVFDDNNCLNVTKIHKQSKEGVSHFALQNVTSFAWQPAPGDGLCVVDSEMTIAQYSLHGPAPTITHRWTFHKLQTEILTRVAELSTVDTLSLVHCTSTACLLLVNTSVFVSIQLLDDGLCKHVATLTIPGASHSCLPLFQIVADQLVVLAEKTETLYIFDIGAGHLWCHVDLQFSKLDPANQMQWRISHDFHRLILIGQDWMLHTLALDAYIKAYPKCLKVESSVFHPYRERTFRPNHSTCRHGDSTWREELLNLHEEKHLKQSSGKYFQSKTRSETKRQRKNVTGFKSRFSVGGVASETIVDSHELPSELRQYTVVDMAVSRFALTLSLAERAAGGSKAICVIDAAFHQIIMKSISGSQRIVLSSTPGHTHLVFSDVFVFHIVTEADVEQEDLVSKLMLYGGATSADMLCDFNKWGRCTVPVHTLQIGIQHRQLDTVAFFLKSKENLFTANKEKPSVSPVTAGEESMLWTSHLCHYDSVQQLESALSFLVQAVRENVNDQQSRDFANKLLTLTLEFLYGLVHNGLSVHGGLGQTQCDQQEKGDLEKAVDLLMGYIAQLRQCLTLARGKLIIKASDTPDGLTTDDSVEDSEWSHLTAEDAVEAATLKNRLLLLQSHLLTSSDTGVARYEQLVNNCMDQVLLYLGNRDMSKAKELLSNLGFDVSAKLWRLAERVKSRDLQMFITSELHKSGSLTPEEASEVSFLQRLYQLYPCNAFSHAMITTTGHRRSAWSDETLLASLMNKTSHEVNSVCGDIGGQGSGGSPDGLYAEVILTWIRSWDQETRERTLLEAQIGKDDFIMEMYPNRKLLWKYLLSHNRHDDALTLLDLMIREVTEDGSSCRQRQDCIIDLYSDLDLCNESMQMEITLRLMKKGFIWSEMLSDFPVLMKHLSRVGGVVCSPHPLQHLDQHTVHHFHHHFLAYCARHQLVLPLWRYCTRHRLQLDKIDVESQDLKTWLTSLQHFFTICRNPDDSEAVYQASLMCAASIWKINDPSLADLIRQDHVNVAVATLPYLPTPLHQNSDVLRLEVFGNMDQNLLQDKLKEYPKLYSALFPTDSIASPRIDVNVYQLLMGSAPLDPRRLFGWQNGNTVAGEECQRLLPYFSQTDLVSQFAYSEKIRYMFYLKHGRPTYAFLSFLAEEIDSGATTISNKRINTVCGVALWIAVKNFTSAAITSACVAFVEMIDQDSLPLRTYIQIGVEILAYKNNGIMGTIDKRKEVMHAHEEEVVDLLLNCVRRRRRNGPSVVEALERATADSIIKKGINSTSFDAAHQWLLTVTVCHLLHLPLSTVFLEECAQADKWLPFLWFAQLHQFPKQQLQGLLHQFRSRHLREHLHYVIENADAKSVMLRRKLSETPTDTQTRGSTKDVRSSLYAKIGLSKGRGNASSDEEDHLSLDSPQGAALSLDQSQPVDLTLTEDSAGEDVFQVVFSSQAAASPWKSLLQASVVLRNSLFAELAACQQDASVAACLCGWLVAMMDRTEHAQFLEAHGKSASVWNMAELEVLIDLYIGKHWEYTLATGFDIFQTYSPLLPFLKFLAELTQGRNYSTCTRLLGDFKDAMSNYREGRRFESSQLIILGNCHWLEQTANRLLQHQLRHTPNLYEALRFVQLLDQENIALVFSFDVPDYSRLHKLVRILHANNLDTVAFPEFLQQDDSSHREREKTIDVLIERKAFADAYKFARLTNLSCDEITLKEMLTEKEMLQKTLVWRSKVARSRFWRSCADKFRLNQVSTTSVMDFFKLEAETIDSMSEKAGIYQLCLELMTCHEATDSLYDGVHRQMWHCRIQAKISQQKGESEESSEPVEEILSVMEATEDGKWLADKYELLCLGKMPPSRRQSHVSTEETDALNSLIGQLLDEGKIRESCQVTSVFHHYSQDLAIILTCVRLSNETVTRETMEPEIRRLLTIDRRSRSSFGSFSGFSRTASSVSLATASTWDFLPVEKEDAIVVMEKLQGHCNHGQQCCLRIITAFKVACVLDVDYAQVVNREEFSILDELLRTSYPQRFILARDYLSTSSLSDDQVASFLSVSIIKALKVSMGGQSGQGMKASSPRDLMFNPIERISMFDQFIKLCKEPSRLGENLLEASLALGDCSDDLHSSGQTLSIQTELMIMAHDCHTVACNMEGISHVLRAARICTDSLTHAEEFSLMIRLLTGVGRFNEMTYIFDALKLHHKFELLLGKGMERGDNLKTAVLDYLKRFHPEDKDSYTMVAHKFMMHREIAHMLEEYGCRNLKALKDKPLENTRDIQENLKRSAQYFSDAAESYVKDSCLRHAHQCLRQARLLELQLQHLSSGVQVVNLSPEGVTALISQHPKFVESLIVSEAYGKRANWSEAIYYNIILNGDFRYLQDLRSHIRLTAPMIQEAINRFQQSANNAPQQQHMNNIKKLLPFCKDVRLQYNIAKDLQLNDVVTSMLKNDSWNYLTDIVAMS